MLKRKGLWLAVLVMGGCAHATTERSTPVSPLAPSRVAEVIVKGKTTKKEIMARLGVPNAVTLNRHGKEQGDSARGAAEGAAELWSYWTAPPAEALQRSGLLKIYRVTVALDGRGVALDYQAGESTLAVP